MGIASSKQLKRNKHTKRFTEINSSINNEKITLKRLYGYKLYDIVGYDLTIYILYQTIF